MTWNRAVVGFGGALADHDLGRDEAIATPARSCSRDAQGSPCSQARDELAPEGTSTLHVEGLVDRLMGDAHGLIIREVDFEAV